MFDLAPYLGWLTLIHVLAVLAFVMVHGMSGLIALRVRRERDRERLKVMVELSSSVLMAAFISLLVLLVAGVLAGIAGGWWTSGRLWIWVSLVVFVVVGGLMTPLASSYMQSVRGALGVPSSRQRGKGAVALEPATDAELERVLGSSRPVWAAITGLAGLAILTWLMMSKPF
jgi:hypothetical protein